jgi:gliding motility-associated-like protein
LKVQLKIYIVLFFCFSCLPGICQTPLSGNINRYAKVVSIGGPDFLTVDDITGFSEGDTVMVVQMKGETINPSNNGLIALKSAGKYEFIIVQKISGTNIIFQSKLLNAYDAQQAVQIVRVPSYSTANVVSPVTCPAWDGNKGGVLALIVFDTLELSADIDASATGFRGGEKTATGSGVCYSSPASLNYTQYATDSAGLKGESMVDANYVYKRGMGAAGNGGGGGNGFGAGGGGGAGYADGGRGAQSSEAYCTAKFDFGGYSGLAPKAYFGGSSPTMRDRIFFGGGGGGSRGLTDSQVSKGGNGGGIAFVLAGTVKGGGRTIRANGESVTDNATDEAGAGGGGGGGFVLFSIERSLNPVKLEAKGGKGGNTSSCFGQGGGGGGGFTWFSGKTLSFNTMVKTGGAPGITLNTSCPTTPYIGFSGGEGDSANYLVPVLNGFLFNFIGKDQTICYGNIPAKITGSLPRGGKDDKYIYAWQSRDKASNYKWKTIAGANLKDYSFGALYDTVDIRRIVKSTYMSTGDTLVDSSKFVRIQVVPEIKSISIGPSDTAVCYGQMPIKLRGSSSFGGNPDLPITYLWEMSANNSSWTTATVPNTLPDYSNPSTQISQYYRRKVMNSICTLVGNTAHVIVHPLIGSNSIQEPQTICEGSIPGPIQGSTPSGGAGTYNYQWLKSTNDSLHWAPVVGETALTYSPGPLMNTMFYRRIVYSGLRNTCVDTSQMLKVKVWPLIGNNSIQSDQTICENTSPNRLIGSVPSGGDGIYHYQWDISDNNIDWTAALALTSDSIHFTSGTLASDRYYRRTVFSGANNCCKSTTSLNVKVTVQPEIQNNIITGNQEICFEQTPVKLIQKSGAVSGGDGTYTFLWEQRSEGPTAWENCPAVNGQSDYQPASMEGTFFYRRKVVSGVCVHLSDSLKINVLPLITGNTLTGNPEVCSQLETETVKGATVSGGVQGVYSYVWQDSISNGSWIDIVGAHSMNYDPGVLLQNTFYRRMVMSGLNDCCVSKSAPFSIKINSLPVGVLGDLDTAICEGKDLNLKLTINSGIPPFQVSLQASLSGNSNEIQETCLIEGSNIIPLNSAQAGIYTLLSVVDNKGCVATDKGGKATVRLVAIPISNAGLNDEVCGLVYQLKASPSLGIGKWSTSFGAVYQSSENDPAAIVTVQNYGIHHFVWKESNEFCVDSASVNVVFYEQPVNADAGNDQKLTFKFSTELGALSPTVGSGIWSVKDDKVVIANVLNPSSEIEGLPFGKSVFTWTVTNGVCPSIQDTVTIDVENLIQYTGFSPNNDGHNDFFVIDGLNNSKKRELTIFNRWGGEVYSSDNYQNNWDGTNKSGEPLPNDTYFYILKVDGERIFKSFVVIKR